MDYQEIKDIIKIMEESKLDSLALEFPDGIKINMTKSDKTDVNNTVECRGELHSPGRTQYAPTNGDNEAVPAKEEISGTIIKSPIVGTFYSSPAPGKEPFVTVGSKVAKGDVICIIEAMKLINEIECEVDGEVAEIFVKNEEVVDFGKPLFRII